MLRVSFNTSQLRNAILFLFCSTVSITYCRTVPARQEICNRFPSMQICQSASQAGLPASPVAPASSVAPQSSPVSDSGANDPTSGTLDRGTYCQQYQAHFAYFCTPTSTQPNSQQATMFCDSYRSSCDSSEAPDALNMTPEHIDEMCKKYGGLAKAHCNGNEPNKIIKEYCNLYRHYCLGQGPPPAAKPTAVSAPDEQATYCATYKGGFYQNCKKPSTEPKTVQFCRSFSDYCNM